MASKLVFAPPRDLLLLVQRAENCTTDGKINLRDSCQKKWFLLKPYLKEEIKNEIEKILQNDKSPECDLLKAMSILEEVTTSIWTDEPNINGISSAHNGLNGLVNGNGLQIKVEDGQITNGYHHDDNLLDVKTESSSSDHEESKIVSERTGREFPLKRSRSTCARSSSPSSPTVKIKDSSDSSDSNSTEPSSTKRKFKTLDDDDDDAPSPGRTLRTRANPEKKIKIEPDEPYIEKPKKKRGRQSLKNLIPPDVCKACRQKFTSPNLQVYSGHPEGAREELGALADDVLSCLYDNEEGAVPENKLTQFAIYDENKHLCALDLGILEGGKHHLYASGWVKQIIDEDSSIDGGIPAKDLGPISQWWVNEDAIGISTRWGDYYLMEPSAEYAPFMESPKMKGRLRKIIVDFLQNDENADATYVDLITHLSELVEPDMPPLNEEILLRHGKAVYEMIVSYDLTRDEEERELATTPCMTDLVDFLGISTETDEPVQRRGRRPKQGGAAVKKTDWSKATTTPLVSAKFESFFPDQLDNNEGKVKKKTRCQVCEACQRKDCGSCANCLDMIKFGGSGILKKGCSMKRCPYMAVVSLSRVCDDTQNESSKSTIVKKMKQDFFATTNQRSIIEWIGEPCSGKNDAQYYKRAKIIRGNEEIFIEVGDCFTAEPEEMNAPIPIGRIQSLYQASRGVKCCHFYLYCRGTDTAIGESADPRELFLSDNCDNIELKNLKTKVNVLHAAPTPEWKNEGGTLPKPLVDPQDDQSFFCRLRYDSNSGRFLDPSLDCKSEDDDVFPKKCPNCVARIEEIDFENHIVSEPLPSEGKKEKFALLKWRGEEYRVGNTAYVDCSVFKFEGKSNEKRSKPTIDLSKIDEDIYPEMYRKVTNRTNNRDDITEPHCIGLITSIHADHLRVYKFYRPENTRGIVSNVSDQDLTKLYGSEEEVKVPFENLQGKCYVVFSENVTNPRAWCDEGYDRFYFTDLYVRASKSLAEPSKIFKKLGDVGKGGGKGAKSAEKLLKVPMPSYPRISRPLRCLDVFAGCGGLSEGLHQSGVADTMWAIEKVDYAARAFKLNNPKSVVFTEDCNEFLRAVMDGKTKNEKGQKLPQKGEVEMLVGGPPCQGFSGMNRFNGREYSQFKNSLIVTYLSFCDYYRPRFFLLENVRNFVSFKNSIVLKLTLSCLVAMGYQVAFGVLQAGNFGVPQTRRRLIIMAAAPGELLPSYPVPVHVFRRSDESNSVMVQNTKYNFVPPRNGAPRRMITVYDALSDLPEIETGSQKEEMPYTVEPITHFQKLVRADMDKCKLVDHICKEMNPIVTARMTLVPKTSTGDWRDLPNIEVKLRGGGYSEKLFYNYRRVGDRKDERLRGVCSCAAGKKCDPMEKQTNTIIPWCLPHTADRHNNWAGLYGRIGWDDVFSTTVTNPEPMGKQGRVLHPEQDRVVSVRECARSQGFPDKYRFYGPILEKHRQVGNAVPPPMGKAIGLEIRKSVSIIESKTS